MQKIMYLTSNPQIYASNHIYENFYTGLNKHSWEPLVLQHLILYVRGVNCKKTVHYKQIFSGEESEHDNEYDFLVKSFENEDESAIQKPGK